MQQKGFAHIVFLLILGMENPILKGELLESHKQDARSIITSIEYVCD